MEKLTPTMLVLWLPCEGRMGLLWDSVGTGAPESKISSRSTVNQSTTIEKATFLSLVFFFFSERTQFIFI